MHAYSRQFLWTLAAGIAVLGGSVWFFSSPHADTPAAPPPPAVAGKPHSARKPDVRTPQEAKATANARPCDRTVLTYLDLSRPPTQAELISAGNLGEPLTPTRSADPSKITAPALRARVDQDNLAFGTAIQAWNQHHYKEAYTLFEEFIKASPASPWAAESQLHLGCFCQYNGRLDEAGAAFDNILSTVEPNSEMYNKAKLRRSILHLDQGNLDASLQGFTEMKRDDLDPQHQTYASYWIRELALLKKNETALRDCGQKSLARVAEIFGVPAAAKELREQASPGPHGFTAAELHATALAQGLDSRPVQAETALDDLPVPFVAHYKDQHYVTVEKVSGGEVRLFDSRVGQATLPRASFMKQWSGFALIFSTPSATAAIHPAENLDSIVGGCCGHPRSPSDLGDDDDSDCNCGMPGWSVNPVNFNFRVKDTPMWWTPPVGPSVSMSLLFNSQDSLTNYQPFGPKWSFLYASYLLITPGRQVQVRDGNGRLQTFTAPVGGGSGYPITYTPPAGEFRTLVETADHVFALTHQDGAIYHYGIPAAMGGTASVPLLLAIEDRHHNSLGITHNAQGCITEISHSMLPAATPTGGGAPVARKWVFTYDAISVAATVTFSGTVMHDYNNDGVGDVPLESAHIHLLDASGQPVTDQDGQAITTTSAVTGAFSFPNLPPGVYQSSADYAYWDPIVTTASSTANPAGTVSRVTRIDDPFDRSASFSYDNAGNLANQSDMGGLAYGYSYSNKLSLDTFGTNRWSVINATSTNHATYELFVSKIHTPKGTTRILTEPSDGQDNMYDIITQAESNLGYSYAYPPIGAPNMWDSYRIRITNPEQKTEEYFFYSAGAQAYYRDAEQLKAIPGQSVNPASAGDRLCYSYAIVGGKGKINTTLLCMKEGGAIYMPGPEIYDANALKPVTIIGVSGNPEHFVYNDQGQVVTHMLPRADDSTISPYQINYTYETNGIDPDQTTRYFDGGLKILRDIDYWPDTRDVKQIKDALGHATVYTWNSNGLPDTVTNSTTGDVTAFVYYQTGDRAWRLHQLKRNNAILKEFDYDPIGRPALETDTPAGTHLRPTFDNLNRLTRTDYSDDSFVEQIRECCYVSETRSGKHTGGQDRVLERTQFFHDHRGLLVKSIDTAGRITQIGYDDAARMTTLTDPMNRVTTWTYDHFGLPEKKIYPDATYEQIFRGYWVLPHKIRNRRGQESIIKFDENGNFKSLAGPDVDITRTYDTLDRLKTIVDTSYSPEVHTYEYDLLGRVTSLDGPWADDTVSYDYDDAARTVTRTTPGGVTETTVADGFGRAASTANPLGVFTSVYNDTIVGGNPMLGVRTGITHTGANAGFNTAFTYLGDDFNRALHTLTSTLPGGDTIARHTYGYDAQNRIDSWQREATLANPSGTTRSFAWTSRYDFASQLTSVAEKSLTGTLQGGWEYGHDMAGNLTSVQAASGIASPASLTNRAHNSLNQITTLGGGGTTTIRGTLSKPGQVSVGLTGHGDKPARMLEGDRFETELPLQQGGNSISIAARDTSGNRSNYTYSVDVASQSPQSFAYDNDGNLTSDGVRGYSWDTESRLLKITWGGGSNKTTEFIYNALGQRCEQIEKTGSTETAHFFYLYEGANLVCRYTGGTTAAAIDRRYFSQGEQRKTGATWNTYYYCRDHLGSVREVMNRDGTLAARYDYDPYGKRLTQYESSTYTGGCDFGFTGHLTQPSPVGGQTELALTHFRTYDPQFGRWLSADPIGESGGMNLYAYVDGNIENYSDPLGLWQVSLFGGRGPGVRISFGNNGGSGLFNGQWNGSVEAGAGAGFSLSIDRNNSGCLQKGLGKEATLAGSFGDGALGANGSIDLDSQQGLDISVGGRAWYLGANHHWSVPYEGGSFSHRQTEGISNYGASGFFGIGFSYAGN